MDHSIAVHSRSGIDGPANGKLLRSMTTRGWLLAILLCCIAIGASSFRIVAAPGFEMYLGPLFYLLAYRIGGLRLALPMVLVTMAASWFWWGHVFSIAISLGHVLFIHRVRFSGSLAIATFVYSLTIGALSAAIFLHFFYDASSTIIALGVIRKLLNDLLMAALVDLGVSVLALDLVGGHIKRRRTFSLAELLPASITVMVVSSALVLFVSSVQRFPSDFKLFKTEMALQAELRIRGGLESGDRFFAARGTNIGMVNGQELVISPLESRLRAPETLQRLGCQQIDSGSEISGPNDRHTFAYWVTACHLHSTQVRSKDYFYIYSTRPMAESAYQSVLLQMIGSGFILVIALLLQLLLMRAVRRSLHAWNEVTDGFGQPGLSRPAKLVFSEFEQPIAAIVAANNSFADLVDERRRMAEAVRQLKQEMDLSLAADIRFDDATGTLHFMDFGIDRLAQPRSEQIHPNDCLAFTDMRNADEAFIEFRLAGANTSDWYLLVARDLLAPGRWRSGWMVHLRQSKLAQNRMLQQARLVELGGMASALSHELKQPLFTISLSAENGRLLLDQPNGEGAARARSKFDRISDQVHRARDIIARISRYARIESNDPEPLDLAEVIRTTLTFMRPLLVQQNVGARVVLPPGPPLRLLAPRVGLEQVMVNAIQNSVDSIATRREEVGEQELVGTIELSVMPYEEGLRIAISDNGSGLMLSHSETAFDAFMTTKAPDHGTGLGLYISRQIVMEIGGKIAIASRETPERGAVVTIDFPKFVVLGQEQLAPDPAEKFEYG